MFFLNLLEIVKVYSQGDQAYICKELDLRPYSMSSLFHVSVLRKGSRFVKTAVQEKPCDVATSKSNMLLTRNNVLDHLSLINLHSNNKISVKFYHSWYDFNFLFSGITAIYSAIISQVLMEYNVALELMS